MKPFAIELDDRALSIARNGQILTSAPSAMFDTTVGAPGALWTAGAGAISSRGSGGPYPTHPSATATPWKALRSRPLAVSTRHLSAVLTRRDLSPRSEALVAAELKARLSSEPIAEGERIWIASPARIEVVGLSALFGITRSLSLPVDGFVDAAAVTVAALGLERNAIVLELGLHHAAATAVDSDAGQTRRRRTVLAERAGFIELYQMWLDLVSTTMVKRTRFDPLHDAATEQQLFDMLPSLARELTTTGNTTAVVTRGTDRFEAAVTRDQFAQTADTVFRAIVGLVHQLRPAGAPVSIVLPRAVTELPGLREHFEQFVGCELIAVPDGFAAAATSLLDLPENGADEDSVRLLRRLSLRTPPEAALTETVSREFLGKRRSGGAPPSHVLLDGRAYALSAGALVVGRTPDKPEATPSAPAPGIGTIPTPYRSITLPDGLAGVSRRHCTFVHDGEELVLLDHSTFGTFVNGERVQERVRIHAGDRVRLGEPGVELALIAVGDPTASLPQS
jgi:FHA domain